MQRGDINNIINKLKELTTKIDGITQDLNLRKDEMNVSEAQQLFDSIQGKLNLYSELNDTVDKYYWKETGFQNECVWKTLKALVNKINELHLEKYSGCDLYLFDQANASPIRQEYLTHAEKKKIPILVRQKDLKTNKNSFMLYGDKQGNGVWGFTPIVGNNELESLPFNETKLTQIGRNNRKFTSTLQETLTKGQANFTDKHFSSNEKINYQIMNLYLHFLKEINDKIKKNLSTNADERSIDNLNNDIRNLINETRKKFQKAYAPIISSKIEETENFPKIKENNKKIDEINQKQVEPNTTEKYRREAEYKEIVKLTFEIPKLIRSQINDNEGLVNFENAIQFLDYLRDQTLDKSKKKKTTRFNLETTDKDIIVQPAQTVDQPEKQQAKRNDGKITITFEKNNDISVPPESAKYSWPSLSLFNPFTYVASAANTVKDKITKVPDTIKKAIQSTSGGDYRDWMDPPRKS